MIEKKIHYCWFGPKKKPILVNRCIDSWKRFCPDWEIMVWNEDNTDMNLSYIEQAYNNRNFANVSNLVRLKAIASEGGIYLDTDIELLKNLEVFRQENCFFGFQDDTLVNNAVMGATKRHPFIINLIDNFLTTFDGLERADLSSPNFVTNELGKLGLNPSVYAHDTKVVVAGITIFPERYFYPYAWDEDFHPSCIKNDTFAIHYWAKSWGGWRSRVADQLKRLLRAFQSKL